jgi:hypothetical protein
MAGVTTTPHNKRPRSNDWEELMQSKKNKDKQRKRCKEETKGPVEVSQEVMPLIYCDNGIYLLNEQAASWIEKLPAPFGVIAVVGKYRTGKSFFLNRVLLQKEPGENTGFGVGPTIQAHTKGLWVSPQLLSCKGQPTLVIDTEGISALDANSTHDTKVFCLALLLSSYFIYNSVGSIDEEALNTLSLVVKVSEQIRRSDRAGSGSGSSSGIMEDMFPSFLWIVRDFALRLRDTNNLPITEAEYLENALKETGDSGSDKNRIRKCLKDFFPQRTCSTMVRPCENEDALQDLDTTPNQGLRDVFVQQMNRLRADIFGSVKQKTACGQPLSGKLFVQMCRAYTDAINKGAAPAIRSTWTMLSQGQCISAMDSALAIYKQKSTFASLPVQQGTLTDVLRMARELSGAEYFVKAFGDETELYSSKLMAAIDEEEEGVRNKNKAALTRLITSNFEALSLGCENATSFEKFKKQYDAVRDTFLTKYPGYEGPWAEAACDFVWSASSSYINASQRRILKELEDASLAAVSARRESHNHNEELHLLRSGNQQLTQQVAVLGQQLEEAAQQHNHEQELLTQSEGNNFILNQKLLDTEAAWAARLQEQQEGSSKQMQDLQGSVREQMESACQRASALEGTVLDLELRLGDAERLASQQKEEIEVHLSNCNRLETELETVNTQLVYKEDLEAEKEALEETLEELQEEMDTALQTAEGEHKQFRDTALQSMEEMKAAQSAERETFKNKVAKLTKQHEGALEDVRSKVAILEQQVVLGEKQVQRKNEEIQGLQEQVVTVNKMKEKLLQSMKEVEVRHTEALSLAEKHYQVAVQGLRNDVTGLHESHTRDSVSLMEAVRAAESRAACAEARLKDHARQLENSRNSDAPKIAGLQTSVRDLTTQLQRSQSELTHLKESKEELNRRLKEATGNIKTLTSKCKDLGNQCEKEIASVKLTYERRISVLEQRLAEIL